MCVQSHDLLYVIVIHHVGAFMAFGLSIVHAWLNVALSFITRRQLSSPLVCWLRLVLAFVTTVMLFTLGFLPVFEFFSYPSFTPFR